MDRYLRKIIDQQLKLLKQNGQLLDKYASVQISIEPSTVSSIFTGLNSAFSLNGNKQAQDILRIDTNLTEDDDDQLTEIVENDEENFESLKTEIGGSIPERLLDSKQVCKKQLINNHSQPVYLPENGEMFLDHDDIELGQECEIESESQKSQEVSVKSEIPEPAVYIETETVENEEYCYEEYIEEHLESDENLEEDEESVGDTVATEVVETVMDRSEMNTPSDIGNVDTINADVIIKDDKFKRRGRPKKSDKHKTPQGVSYLKSGRKNVQVFSKQRKSGRPK